ncbi:GNAT family N-acetyltransferase, partial [Aquiflexum sp.]|uniref:GNAT family N-acetyltransferase n=1 Tax=Aquiflexum sp. TaxID=1872584 RepID=UPI0035931146
ILKYADKHREQLLEVWEHSVLATHLFLKTEDFLSIKALVKTMDFHDLEVYCLVQNNAVYGFLGVAERKLEMLFLSPDLFGKGHGKKLMEFAVRELKIDKVDVNEQNTKAVGFYNKFGFKTYQRTEKDDQGNDYPLLRMKLE